MYLFILVYGSMVVRVGYSTTILLGTSGYIKHTKFVANDKVSVQKIREHVPGVWLTSETFLTHRHDMHSNFNYLISMFNYALRPLLLPQKSTLYALYHKWKDIALAFQNYKNYEKLSCDFWVCFCSPEEGVKPDWVSINIKSGVGPNVLFYFIMAMLHVVPATNTLNFSREFLVLLVYIRLNTAWTVETIYTI